MAGTTLIRWMILSRMALAFTEGTDMAANLKVPRIVDKAYRRSAQHRHCAVRHPETGDYCNGEGVVCAHISMPENRGERLKAPDDESLWLCTKHHDEFDGRGRGLGGPIGGALWLVRNVYIPERKAAYRAYKMGVGR